MKSFSKATHYCFF